MKSGDLLNIGAQSRNSQLFELQQKVSTDSLCHDAFILSPDYLLGRSFSRQAAKDGCRQQTIS
jgi:hypothetical protein